MFIIKRIFEHNFFNFEKQFSFMFIQTTSVPIYFTEISTEHNDLLKILDFYIQVTDRCQKCFQFTGKICPIPKRYFKLPKHCLFRAILILKCLCIFTVTLWGDWEIQHGHFSCVCVIFLLSEIIEAHKVKNLKAGSHHNTNNLWGWDWQMMCPRKL